MGRGISLEVTDITEDGRILKIFLLLIPPASRVQ
jgi:hypothetical protein